MLPAASETSRSDQSAVVRLPVQSSNGSDSSPATTHPNPLLSTSPRLRPLPSQLPSRSFEAGLAARSLPKPRSRSKEARPTCVEIVRRPLPGASESLPSRPARAPPVPPQLSVGDGAGARPHTARPLSPRSRPSPGLHPFEDPERGNKAIFAPLEEYIVHHYGNFGSLNLSFVKRRRRPHATSRSQDEAGKKLGSPLAHTETPGQAPLSEMDAKTLLIGDIAENGLWWTRNSQNRAVAGAAHANTRSDRPTERGTSLVTFRSPQISWLELAQWYNMVISVGRDWKYSIRAGSDDANDRVLSQLEEAEVSRIDAAMAEARFHVQRTLLKVTEGLLKRPGRPLKDSADVRFLLLILANPMLYPGAAASAPLREPAAKESLKVPSVSTNVFGDTEINQSKPIGPWEQGNAFGIVKRIFGLLANSTMESQRALVSWFSRYDEEHFRSLVNLQSFFVTHRLRRKRGRKRSNSNNAAMNGLIPSLSGTSRDASAELHAALGLSGKKAAKQEATNRYPAYSDDWQVKAAAKVMALLFAANKTFHGERSPATIAADAAMSRPGSLSRTHIKNHGQLMSTTDFYNTLVDTSDLILDFDTWEQTPSKFSFCQYPFFLSVGSKIKIMEHDAKRQMELKAREAFFKSIMRNADVHQHLLLKVRRDCLVDDSLKGISEVVAQGQEEIKKGLKVEFVNEEGIDAGGLRKEWFLLLIREIFDPMHGKSSRYACTHLDILTRLGMFIYDDESQFCYFNPHSWETSDQYFLVGAILGLAIYNTTILDVALPPLTFKKLLLSGYAPPNKSTPFMRGPLQYTLEDLAEWRPRLARGLRQLLEFTGDVQETFCRDFIIEVDKYGVIEQVPLCPGGESRPVTNSNRQEFVDLYIRFLLDKQVTRQFEPFKRGFFTIAGGNALSLFQPEEIELLVRGSDEPLDVLSLKAVASYENWQQAGKDLKYPAEEVLLLRWFWESFEAATPVDQRKLLSFITGSDRIPAVGATQLHIKVSCAGPDWSRYPIARTCFNQILLYQYRTKAELEDKLWAAVAGSEGFGLK